MKRHQTTHFVQTTDNDSRVLKILDMRYKKKKHFWYLIYYGNHIIAIIGTKPDSYIYVLKHKIFIFVGKLW